MCEKLDFSLIKTRNDLQEIENQAKGESNMGTRAYLLVNVKDDVNQKAFSTIINDLEKIHEVDFVDPVVGNWDIIIMIEAPITVEAVANKIRALPWAKEVATQKIVSLYERHRSSKEELLQALKHQGA